MNSNTIQWPLNPPRPIKRLNWSVTHTIISSSYNHFHFFMIMFKPSPESDATVSQYSAVNEKIQRWMTPLSPCFWELKYRFCESLVFVNFIVHVTRYACIKNSLDALNGNFDKVIVQKILHRFCMTRCWRRCLYAFWQSYQCHHRGVKFQRCKQRLFKIPVPALTKDIGGLFQLVVDSIPKLCLIAVHLELFFPVVQHSGNRKRRCVISASVP